MNTEEQYAFLINSMKKLLHIDETKLTKEQKNEILLLETEICDKLEFLKTERNVLDEDFHNRIQNTIQKYFKYIRKECFQ